MNFDPGDDEEEQEDEGGEAVLEDIESDEGFDDEDEDEDPDEDEDSEDEPDEEGFIKTKNKRIDPDTDDVTHAIDCPLDSTCSCGDDE